MSRTAAPRFGEVSSTYDFGRLSYPPEAVRWVLSADPKLVVDLAAGTGKLTASLAADGAMRVLAVEPDEAMLHHVPKHMAWRVQARAEYLPVATASIDAVLVAQALHWFDLEDAMSEIRRVLKPGGVFGVLAHADDDRVDWISALCDLTESPARASAISSDLPEVVQSCFRVEFDTFAHSEFFTPHRLSAMIASRSGVMALSHQRKKVLLSKVECLAPGASFEFHSVCLCWRLQAPT